MASDLTAAIYTRAAATAGLTSLLGTSPFRFYPVRAPDAVTARPFVVFAVISGVREKAGGGYAGLTRTRVHVESYQTTHALSVTLDRAIRDAFNAFTGASVTVGSDTVTILSMEHQEGSDFYDEATKTFVRARDILFWWRDNA